jgi:hypothetical protein
VIHNPEEAGHVTTNTVWTFSVSPLQNIMTTSVGLLGIAGSVAGSVRVRSNV